ncbi:hypothetical protein GOBAR_AA09810 [Gossypium barbadense]|uniref:DM2 domain-containing protein n=1 Tax=Gossypium barbadense TaxID=3634 RepID=A0A2P5Y5G7_GOSBA|nr:hypothetical protein GOBAR_AA09810 [Gossypium barbadense]
MVLDSELIARLWEFLGESDLNTTTTAIVRRRLEEDFGIDLTDRKKFIREQTDKIKSEETDGSDSDDEEEEPERAKNKKATSKKRESLPWKSSYKVDHSSLKGVNSEGKRRGGGFNKVSKLSPQLQELLGVPEMARTEVVKQMWVYIREKNLQDPVNKKNIICDEPLHALFGVESIDMFQMNKALSKHILPLDSDEVKSMEREKPRKHEREEVKSTEKEKPRKHEREEDPDEAKGKEKRQKGFLAPLQLSDALVKFLGTGENELTRAVVIKRMWDYIKENNLQDPADKRKVICDEKLKELFEVETFHGFTVTKLLAAHFLKS